MSFSRRIIKYSAVFLAVCAVISATGCNSDSTDNEIVTSITDQVQFSYETAKAQYMTIEETEKIPALLAFGESDSYYAPFDGKIKVNNLSKNLKVKKGDVLIAIDTTDLDFQINEQQIKIDTMTDSIEKGYAQIELDKLIEQRDGAIITAPYDGIIADCCYSAVGANIKSGTLLCTIAVPESIFVYNSEGAGKNLRFGMDVDLVINNADYEGTITAAPDTIPSDASKEASKYSAAKLTEESLKKLLEINDGAIATDAGWATIHAVTIKRTNVLAVPEAAVKKNGTKNYCSILQGTEKYDMPVEIGATAGGYIEIVSGLNEGDVVILSESTSNSGQNNNNNDFDNEEEPQEENTKKPRKNN